METPKSPPRVSRDSRIGNVCPARNTGALREWLWNIYGLKAARLLCFSQTFPHSGGMVRESLAQSRWVQPRRGWNSWDIPGAWGHSGRSYRINPGNFSPIQRHGSIPNLGYTRVPQDPIPRRFSRSKGRDFILGSLPSDSRGGSGVGLSPLSRPVATLGSGQGQKRDVARWDSREDPGWIQAGSAPHSRSSSGNGRAWTTRSGPVVAPWSSGALPDPRSSAKALREEKLRKIGNPEEPLPLHQQSSNPRASGKIPRRNSRAPAPLRASLGTW